MTALLVGKTMAGMRAQDLVRGIDVLAGRSEVDPANITLGVRGAASISGLYAALFDSRIGRIAVDGMLSSYDAVMSDRLAIGVVEQIVPSVLKYFDLPDVIAALAPRRVILAGLVNPVGQRMRPAGVRKEYATASSAYKKAGAARAFQLAEGAGETASFSELLKNSF